LLRLRWLLFCCAAAATYLGAAFWIKATRDPILIEPNVLGRKILLHRPFVMYRESPNAVVVPDYWFVAGADTNEDPTRSEILLFENGKQLGPWHHQPHYEIATKGMGRYAHWGSIFLFSSSDNTNPNTNGRNYWAVDPFLLKPPGKIVVAMKPPFETFAGSHIAIAHHVDQLKEFANEPGNENSPVIVYEDEQPLGPPHSLHREIAEIGKGRYSHWKTQGIVFSTSDNSDPNTNGRRYWAVIPE